MTYEEAIYETAEDIIENKDYDKLKIILKSYDIAFKSGSSLKDFELPFWYYCCVIGDDKVND